MQKLTTLFATFLFLFNVSFSITYQTSKDSTAKKPEKKGTPEQLKPFNAKQEYLRGNYRAAYKLYSEAFEAKPQDGELALGAGECALLLNKYPKAVELLEKAKTLLSNSADYKLHLFLGQAYHMTEQLDKALDEFNTYKAKEKSSKEIRLSNVEVYIEQCNTAKELMKTPQDIIVTNAGENINSKYDDKTPVLAPNGKTIYFTSRRPADKNSLIDEEGDRKYFDDIYQSQVDDVLKTWNPAEPLPGSINDPEGHDACTSISLEGDQLYIYKNSEFRTGGGDVYISQLSPTGKWEVPYSIKDVNTPYYEGSAFILPGAGTLYFVSERKGGSGKGDIYMIQRISGNDWEKPMNLGPVVNTSEDEAGVYMAPDGKTLFFCSKGHKSMGSYDIFKTINDNGQWTAPVNLGYPFNTVWRDGPITFSTDGRTAYISSDRAGGFGETDIYKIDLKTTLYKVPLPTVKKGTKTDATGLAILKGTVMDVEAGQAVETDITIYDEFGNRITAIKSNIDGEYTVTLPGDKKYDLKIDTKQHKSLKERVYLPADEDMTIVIEKEISLHRK